MAIWFKLGASTLLVAVEVGAGVAFELALVEVGISGKADTMGGATTVAVVCSGGGAVDEAELGVTGETISVSFFVI
jgi:hypothetical protein